MLFLYAILMLRLFSPNFLFSYSAPLWRWMFKTCFVVRLILSVCFVCQCIHLLIFNVRVYVACYRCWCLQLSTVVYFQQHIRFFFKACEVCFVVVIVVCIHKKTCIAAFAGCSNSVTFHLLTVHWFVVWFWCKTQDYFKSVVV